MTLFFWIAFSIAIGAVAGKYGRSSLGWFFLALLISPLLAILFLLIAGKTPEQKAKEMSFVERRPTRCADQRRRRNRNSRYDTQSICEEPCCSSSYSAASPSYTTR
jgi:hypothetical protein